MPTKSPATVKANNLSAAVNSYVSIEALLTSDEDLQTTAGQIAAVSQGGAGIRNAKVDFSTTMEVVWVELPSEATAFVSVSGHPYPTAPIDIIP